MLIFREMITGFYKNDEQRFRVAQILFVTSIALGWFIADGYRRGLFLLAIMLLNKSQRKINVRRCWTGLTKVTGFILTALFLWVTLVPLFSGMEPFYDRVEGMARPIEVFLYCAGTMIFARDAFFEKHLFHFSVASAIFVSFFAFTRRLLLSFSEIRDDWAFGMHAALAGLIIASLLPWLFYAICKRKTTRTQQVFYIIAIIVAFSAIFVTYYRTIWIAVIAQLLFAIPLSYYCFNANILNHKKLLAVLLLSASVIVGHSYHTSFVIKDRVDRLVSLGSNFKNFTNNRVDIWKEAALLISQRKLGGYGWVPYNDFAVIKMHHPHSSYLEAAFHAGIPAGILYGMAFVTSFMLALRYIFTKKGPASIAYVVSLMILAAAVGGLTEAFFYASREYLVPFWSMVSMLLSPLYAKQEGGTHCGK